MCEGILLAMLTEGRRVMKEPECYEARATIMWAAVVAHNDIVGVGLAIMFPAWMKYVYKRNLMPSSLKELGGKKEDIPVLVENMFYNKPHHGSFVSLTKEDAAAIYRLALKI